MTSDTAQTEPVAADAENLRELIVRARFVLFAFDGPICRLFAGYPARDIAACLVSWLEGQGFRGLLTPEERQHPDPQVVLHAVNERRPCSDLLSELEQLLTQHELEAARTAYPTVWADPLIRTWTAVGTRLAVVTNNSARTVTRYLGGRQLLGCFAPHIYGRTSNLDLLKPHPHILNQAVHAMGATPSTTLVIGGSAGDHEAARRAGIPFLGHARTETSACSLRNAGAETVVSSLQPLLELVRELH
ncbi:HAD family hydrolase [Streptomyces sp. NPDC001537]